MQLELERGLMRALDGSTIGLVGLAVESRVDEVGATEREVMMNERGRRRSSALARSPLLEFRRRNGEEDFEMVFEDEDEEDEMREKEWEEEKWRKEQKRLELAHAFFRDRFDALDAYMLKIDALVWLDMRTRPQNFRRDKVTSEVPVDRKAERALRVRFCETTLRKAEEGVRREMRVALEQWG